MDKDGNFKIAPNSKRNGAIQLPSEWEEVNNLWFIHTMYFHVESEIMN